MPRQKLKPSQPDFNPLLERAAAGDSSAMPALRELMTPTVWKQIGDLASQAQVALIKKLSAGNLLTQEAVARRLHEVTEEVRGSSCSPLEELLVQRIGATWLHLHYAECIFNQSTGSFSIAQADYHERRLTQSQKRYLSAIKALAQVRKLRLPAIQVNLAENQVNIAERQVNGAR